MRTGLKGPALWLALLTPATGVAAEEVQPLNVYVCARTVGEPLSKSEKKAREKELKVKKDEAKKARKELDKKLKAQYGKDRDEWPEEQQKEYRLAKEAETMANFELYFLKRGSFAKGKQEDLDDSVTDVEKAIGGKNLARKKKWIRVVKDRDQAHLLAEIFDRHGYGLMGCKLAVHISPGQALSSNQPLGINPKGGATRLANTKHTYRPDEPYWIFECTSGNSCGGAAGCVSGTIDAFIKDNRDILTGDAAK